MSLGIVTVAACVACLPRAETGCAVEARAGSVEARTKSDDSSSRPPGPLPHAPPVRRAGRRTGASRPPRELVAALSDGRREAIVLAPGIYDNSEAVRRPRRRPAVRVAARPAVFKAGRRARRQQRPPGRFDQRAELRRLATRGRRCTVRRARLGLRVGGTVLDTRLDGNGVIDAGLVVRQAQGFVARRIVASAIPSYGVVVDPNNVDYRTRRRTRCAI